MVRVGLAGPSSFDYLHRRGLLRGDTGLDFSRDTVLVASQNGQEAVALALARPMMWVHGLAVAPGIERRAVEGLLNYALGWGPAAPRLPSGCLFQVDAANANMVAVARNLEAVEEPNRPHLFRLDL